MTRFSFSIPALTPSENKLIKGRTNRWDYRKLREDWHNWVKVGCQYIEIPEALPYEKRRVDVVSYRVSLLDRDNLVGGMKPLFDGMVSGGLLFDDGPKYLEKGEIDQVRVPKRSLERTEVVLTIF